MPPGRVQVGRIPAGRLLAARMPMSAGLQPVERRAPDWVDAWRPPAGAYGSCPSGGTRLVLVLDESGSVSGADPVAYRHALLDRVVDTLADSCSCGQCETIVVLFGAGRNTVSRLPATHSWQRRSGSREALFGSLPVTGSFIRPALGQVESLGLREHDVVLGLTDLLLFDADVTGELERFSRLPNPLILVLDGEHDEACPVPTVGVPVDSAPTTVADTIASHVTSARPATAPLHADGGTGEGGGVRRPRRSGRWLWPLLAALLLVPLTLMVGSALTGYGPATSSGSNRPVAVEEPPRPLPAAGARADDFTIPGLTGSAPRTTPALTTIVVDRALSDSPAVMRQIRAELPDVVGYMRSYGIAGDKLKLGSDAMTPIADEGLSKAAGGIAPSRFVRVSGATARAGSSAPSRVVVVLTDRPAAWLKRLSPGTGKDTALYFVADIGDPRPVPSTLTGTGPWTLPAGDRTAGGIAIPVARAWAQGIDADWTG